MDTKISTKQAKIAKATKDGRVSHRKIRSRRCSLCHRVTKDTVTVDLSHKKDARPSDKAPQERPEEVVSSDPNIEKQNKPSGKKRAKARKDREGLQALLNNSVQTRSAPGLSLMDLMKR
jgi:hypothetical protein